MSGAGQELCSPRRWTRAAQLPSDSVWNLMVFVSHVFQINQFSFLCFRGVFSMVILKMTETQAGEYRLLIQSAANNYTVLFTVSIRSKCHLLLGFLNILKGWLESKSSYQVPQTVLPGFPRHVAELSFTRFPSTCGWINWTHFNFPHHLLGLCCDPQTERECSSEPLF